jgi:hypothetical protein
MAMSLLPKAVGTFPRIEAIREGLIGTDNQRGPEFEMIVRLADGDLARLPLLAKDLATNRVEAQLLMETIPTLTSIGVLWDPSTGSLQLDAVKAAANSFHIGLEIFEVSRVAQIAEAFYALDRSRLQGVLIWRLGLGE